MPDTTPTTSSRSSHPCEEAGIIIPIYRGRNGDPERLSTLPQVTQLVNVWLQAHNHYGMSMEGGSKPSFQGGEAEAGESLRQMNFISWVERTQPEGKDASSGE